MPNAHTSMQYRKLGSSGLRVSVAGYGGWALGKKGWPGTDEQEAARALVTAVELGVNFFDTAPIYGLGRSELLLGERLCSIRSQVILATKCGLRWDSRGHVQHNLTRDSIYQEIEQSLTRLKTDYIDVYQLHWPDPGTPLEETLEAIIELQDKGLIRHIGLCNYPADDILRALKLAAITSVQHPFNMLQREAEAAILPLCARCNLGFIAYSPLAQGLLAGNFTPEFKPGRRDVRRLNPLFSGESFHAGCNLARSMKNPATEALAFAARPPEVSTVVISMTKCSHVRENCAVFSNSR